MGDSSSGEAVALGSWCELFSPLKRTWAIVGGADLLEGRFSEEFGGERSLDSDFSLMPEGSSPRQMCTHTDDHGVVKGKSSRRLGRTR